MRVERIGGATLYLGDCRQILPAIEAADHVISDPPYEARMQRLHAEHQLRRNDGRALRKALDFDDISDLRAPFLDQVKRLNKGWLLAFCNVEGVGAWQEAIVERGMKFKTTCIWNKPDATPKLNGQGPALSYECFTTTWCGKGYARWNGGGRRGVFTHPQNGPERTRKHPTEKPPRLMRELVALFSSPGELILDPFMGSGTTGVACLQLGRRFIGCELNPVYFEVAVERMRQVEAQPRLFAEPAPRAKQSGLAL